MTCEAGVFSLWVGLIEEGKTEFFCSARVREQGFQSNKDQRANILKRCWYINKSQLTGWTNVMSKSYSLCTYVSCILYPPEYMHQNYIPYQEFIRCIYLFLLLFIPVHQLNNKWTRIAICPHHLIEKNYWLDIAWYVLWWYDSISHAQFHINKGLLPQFYLTVQSGWSTGLVLHNCRLLVKEKNNTETVQVPFLCSPMNKTPLIWFCIGFKWPILFLW